MPNFFETCVVSKRNISQQDTTNIRIRNYFTKMGRRKVGCGGMGWMELAQERDRWRALVNAVMKLYIL